MFLPSNWCHAFFHGNRGRPLVLTFIHSKVHIDFALIIFSILKFYLKLGNIWKHAIHHCVRCNTMRNGVPFANISHRSGIFPLAATKFWRFKVGNVETLEWKDLYTNWNSVCFVSQHQILKAQIKVSHRDSLPFVFTISPN